MGQETVGAVLMYRRFGLDPLPLSGIDGAETVTHLSTDPVDPLVTIAEMGTAAESS